MLVVMRTHLAHDFCISKVCNLLNGPLDDPVLSAQRLKLSTTQDFGICQSPKLQKPELCGTACATSLHHLPTRRKHVVDVSVSVNLALCKDRPGKHSTAMTWPDSMAEITIGERSGLQNEEFSRQALAARIAVAVVVTLAFLKPAPQNLSPFVILYAVHSIQYLPQVISTQYTATETQIVYHNLGSHRATQIILSMKGQFREPQKYNRPASGASRPGALLENTIAVHAGS